MERQGVKLEGSVFFTNARNLFSARIPGNFYVVYLIDFVIQAIGSYAYYFIVFNTSIYFIGMCFYVNTMVVDLKTRVAELNRNYLQARSGANYIPMEDRQAWAAEIRFHNEIIELDLHPQTHVLLHFH